jgi:hypothetical protein
MAKGRMVLPSKKALQVICRNPRIVPLPFDRDVLLAVDASFNAFLSQLGESFFCCFRFTRGGEFFY